jgi:hypothetical protein
MQMSSRFVAVVVALVTPLAALAWGVPKVPSAGGGGTLTAAMIDSFAQKAAVADASMKASAEELYRAIGTKEQRAEYELKLTAAQAKTDPKEKDAAVQELKASATSALAAQNFEAATSAHIDSLSAEQRTQLTKAAGNFIVATVANVTLVQQGKELAKQKPDLTAATKVPELTSSVASLVGQTKQALTVAMGLQKLAQAGKLELPSEAVASLTKLDGVI